MIMMMLMMIMAKKMVMLIMVRCDILVRLAKWRVQWGIYGRHYHSNLWTYADADADGGNRDCDDSDDDDDVDDDDKGDEICDLEFDDDIGCGKKTRN